MYLKWNLLDAFATALALRPNREAVGIRFRPSRTLCGSTHGMIIVRVEAGLAVRQAMNIGAMNRIFRFLKSSEVQ